MAQAKFSSTFKKYKFLKVESISATKASAGARGLAQAKFSSAFVKYKFLKVESISATKASAGAKGLAQAKFSSTFVKYKFLKVESISATKASAGAKGLAQAKFSSTYSGRKMMSLIMFDYDGVIADSFDVHVKSFLAAFHENGFTKLKSSQDIIDLYEDNVYQSMADLGLSEEKIDQILASYKKRQDLVLEQIDLFEHMDSFLKELSLENKIYIITSNVSGPVLKVLEQKGISCVEKVMGSEIEKSKIKKMHQVMAQHPDLRPYYVGDTKGDIIEGRHAGATTVGVAWGWHGADKLREAGPDYLIFAPEELLELLKTD